MCSSSRTYIIFLKYIEYLIVGARLLIALTNKKKAEKKLLKTEIEEMKKTSKYTNKTFHIFSISTSTPLPLSHTHSYFGLGVLFPIAERSTP